MDRRKSSPRISTLGLTFAACISVAGASAAATNNAVPTPADTTKAPGAEAPKGSGDAADAACGSYNRQDEKKVFADALARWIQTPDYSTHSVDIYTPYRITPAGGQISVDVDRAYLDATTPTKITGAKNLVVKAIFQQGRDAEPAPEKVVLSTPVAAEPIPDSDEYAKSVSLPTGSSRLRFDVPSGLAKTVIPFNWSDGRLTVVGCDHGQLAFIGQRDTSYSDRTASLVSTALLTAIIYIMTAVAVSRYENSWRVKTRRISWIRCLDPVVLASGPNAAGSISRLQILFFSVLVFGILTFILIRVGLLTALSSTVLLLLGISAFGAAASKVADNQKSRLGFDNWAWLIKKRWLPPNGIGSVTIAKWKDIVTGSDGFDIYHFQMLVFSLVVGLGLLKVGFTELATFEVPESLLALLGLTQAVYVTGKIVDQPTIQELDTAITDLRKLEDAFLKETAGAKNLAEAVAKAAPLKAPSSPQDPKAPAQLDSYQAYEQKRDNILPTLNGVFLNYSPRDEFFDDGVKNPTETLEPGYPYPADLPP